MIRDLPRLRADGTAAEGAIPLDRQRQCEASPAAGVFANDEPCKARLHVWHRHPNADAYTCHECDLTYLGGPTVVIKTETLS